LIQDAIIEREIIGSVTRFEKRIDVQDNGDLGGIVIADESEKVGDVGFGVEGGDGRLPVAGRKTRRRGNDECRQQRADDRFHTIVVISSLILFRD
jgi:hypothetical protein